jgi:hypothetical protein
MVKMINPEFTKIPKNDIKSIIFYQIPLISNKNFTDICSSRWNRSLKGINQLLLIDPHHQTIIYKCNTKCEGKCHCKQIQKCELYCYNYIQFH